MIAVLVLDLFFVGAAVYLFVTDRVVPGIVMLAMGMAAVAIVVVRRNAAARPVRPGDDDAKLFESRAPAKTSIRPEAITLEPELEAEVRGLLSRSKIAAVARVKEATGASLSASKAYVDALERS